MSKPQAVLYHNIKLIEWDMYPLVYLSSFPSLNKMEILVADVPKTVCVAVLLLGGGMEAETVTETKQWVDWWD